MLRSKRFFFFFPISAHFNSIVANDEVPTGWQTPLRPVFHILNVMVRVHFVIEMKRFSSPCYWETAKPSVVKTALPLMDTKVLTQGTPSNNGK